MKIEGFVLILLFGVCLLPIACAQNIAPKLEEKGYLFIRDVASIDVSRYNISRGPVSIHYVYGNLPTQTLKFALTSDSSDLEIVLDYVNYSFTSYNLYIIKGLPIYKQPLNSIMRQTKVFLQQYQTNLGVSLPVEMSELAEAICNYNMNFTTRLNDVTLYQSSYGNESRISWVYSAGEVNYNYSKAVGMTFRNNYVVNFGDGWNLFTVNDIAQNISRENAIKIGFDTASKFKLVFPQGEVPFKISINNTTSELYASSKIDSLVLYPYWHVAFFLEKPVSGVYGIEVGIWADDGKVFYCNELASAGYPSDSSFGKGSKTSPPAIIYLLDASFIALVAMAAITLALLISKRRKAREH